MSKVQIFSVVIPLYNKEATIERAIKSVLSQTSQDFEIIVVNDGSTDDGADIVSKIADARIRVIHQINQGVSAARNKGIAEAKSDFIAFLDADDEWLPHHLKKLLQLINSYPECQMFASNYISKELCGKSHITRINGLPKKNWQGVIENYFKIAIKSDPLLCSSAIVVSKNAINAIGAFPISITAGEDLLTWAKLSLNYKIVYSTDVSAIVWLRSPMHGKPTRYPDNIDRVSSELINIYNLHKNNVYLAKYIGMWHKMRSSSYLKFGHFKEARNEIITSLRFYKTNYVLYIYLLLTYCPKNTYYLIVSIINYFKK